MFVPTSAKIATRHIAVLAVAVLVALLGPVEAHGAKKKKKKDKSIVSGVVMSQSDEILEGAKVTVIGSDSTVLRLEATTDGKGEFEIEVPTAGHYVLRLEKAGYTDFENQIYLETGEQQSIKINLLDAAAGLRNKAVQAYNQGAKAYEARDMATAKSHFLVATEADPTLAQPFLVLADIYLTEKLYNEAAAAAEQYLALQPEDHKGQLLAYEAYQKVGNHAKVDELRAVLGKTDAAPQLAIQAYNEGAMANQRGEVEAAIGKFQSALDLDPNLAEAHAALASVFYNQQRYDESLAALEQTLKLKPDHVPALRVSYLVHDTQGHLEEAGKAMDAYLALDPEGAANLLYQRADLDFRAGESGAATVALLKVLEAQPEMARAHYTLGLIYASGDTAKARQHLEKFIELAPDDPEVAAAKEMMSYF